MTASFIKKLTRVYNGLMSNDGTGDNLRAGANDINSSWDSIEQAVNSLASSQGSGVKPYATLTALTADMTQPDGVMAVVYADATPANNTSYVRQGGAWVTAYDRLTYAVGNGSGFQQAGTGASLRTLQDKDRDRVHVKDFGAIGDGSDDTTRLQNALDATPDGGVLSFTKTGATFTTGELHISKSIRIELNGAKFDLSGARLFALTANVDFVEIVGCGGVSTGVAAGTECTKEFFSDWDQVSQRDYNNASLGTKYATQRLVLERNIFSTTKMTVMGSHKSIQIVRNIANTSSSDPFTLPYTVMVGPGDNAPARVYGDFVISGNHVDVYAANDNGGSQFYDGNFDLFKITRAATGVKFHNNYIRNGNSSQKCAQVDLFTGAHCLSSMGNTFVNVQLHRKQQVGAVTNPDFGLDTYVADQFIIQSGFQVKYITASQTRNNPIMLHGGRIEMLGCKVLNESDYPLSAIMLLAFTDVWPGFGIKGSTFINIIGGVYDLRSDVTTKDSCLLQSTASTSDQQDQYLKFMGCTLLGGVKLIRNPVAGAMPKLCQLIGVTWNGSGVTVAADLDCDFASQQVAIGNTFDNPIRLSGVQTATDRKSGYVNPAPSATMNVDPYVTFRFDGTGTLTGLTGGKIGQRVLINKINSQGTVQHGTSAGSISLSGSTNFGMQVNSVLEVELAIDGIWHEVNRTDARRKTGTTAQRPVVLSGEGYTYYDTTISKPAFWNGTAWKDATGTTV